MQELTGRKVWATFFVDEQKAVVPGVILAVSQDLALVRYLVHPANPARAAWDDLAAELDRDGERGVGNIYCLAFNVGKRGSRVQFRLPGQSRPE